MVGEMEEFTDATREGSHSASLHKCLCVPEFSHVLNKPQISSQPCTDDVALQPISHGRAWNGAKLCALRQRLSPSSPCVSPSNAAQHASKSVPRPLSKTEYSSFTCNELRLDVGVQTQQTLDSCS